MKAAILTIMLALTSLPAFALNDCGPGHTGQISCENGRERQRICGCTPSDWYISGAWTIEDQGCFSRYTGRSCNNGGGGWTDPNNNGGGWNDPVVTNPHNPYDPYQPDPYDPDPLPNQPYNPYQPGQPHNPYDPYQPNQPYNPYDPYQPNNPYDPYDPYQPNYPGNPNDPYSNNAQACFFEHANFQGQSVCLPMNSRIANLGGYLRGRISSIRIFGPIQVTIYDRANFSGRSITTRNAIQNLGNLSGGYMNDRTVSINVR